ncbi:MAG: outer membrane lipoprotein carrier protein LolA [Phycisphaerae bacterium]
MNKKIIIKASVILLWMVSPPLADWASECPKSSDTEQPVEEKVNTVDTVLKQLNKKALELTSYQAQIEYGFIQPLLESETLRKGILYYAKLGKKSKLRLNFQTLKQEDEEEEKYIEQYIVLDGVGLTCPGHQFKGTWLVHIDYQIEGVKYYQLAEAKEPNKPVDVFDLASRNFPMIGFTKIEDMQKQFEVTLVEQKKSEPEDFIQVHLKVKPNSVYKDDYIYIDFWIDEKLGLPAKVVAVTTEEEIYRIKFIKAKVNKKIDSKVFEFKIPEGFGEPEIIPLKQKGE